eukprot:gene3560-13632_t
MMPSMEVQESPMLVVCGGILWIDADALEVQTEAWKRMDKLSTCRPAQFHSATSYCAYKCFVAAADGYTDNSCLVEETDNTMRSCLQPTRTVLDSRMLPTRKGANSLPSPLCVSETDTSCLVEEMDDAELRATN